MSAAVDDRDLGEEQVDAEEKARNLKHEIRNEEKRIEPRSVFARYPSPLRFAGVNRRDKMPQRSPRIAKSANPHPMKLSAFLRALRHSAFR